jgi:hypothetical protein
VPERSCVLMSRLFEELDYRPTPIGALVLRRRREARLGVDVLEIKLGEEHLMSDLFTASEIALAELGLAACAGEGLDVVVGGLGLGYTARAALGEPRLGSLVVVEYLEAVIDWHRDRPAAARTRACRRSALPACGGGFLRHGPWRGRVRPGDPGQAV